jgi:hypothetical protein
MNSKSANAKGFRFPISYKTKRVINPLLNCKSLNEIWLDEAQRRADRIDQGEIELISAQDVSIKAKALLS